MNVAVAVSGLTASAGRVVVGLTVCTDAGHAIGASAEVDFAATPAQRAVRFVEEGRRALAERGVVLAPTDIVAFFGVAG